MKIAHRTRCPMAAECTSPCQLLKLVEFQAKSRSDADAARLANSIAQFGCKK